MTFISFCYGLYVIFWLLLFLWPFYVRVAHRPARLFQAAIVRRIAIALDGQAV